MFLFKQKTPLMLAHFKNCTTPKVFLYYLKKIRVLPSNLYAKGIFSYFSFTLFNKLPLE